MIICIKIGTKESIKTESRSWTTSHFVLFEGSEETEHVKTTIYYLTPIEIYVDKLDSYIRCNGQVSEMNIDFVPFITRNAISVSSLSELTGMVVEENLLKGVSGYLGESALLMPKLRAGLYAFIGEDTNNGCHSFKYERIEFTGRQDGLTLARTIKAITHETIEHSY